MKCNQCGTTIPEGSKKCNGCGTKVTMFSNIQNTKPINNNYKIIDNYNKVNGSQREKQEKIENLLQQSKLSINNIEIQDKNASLAIILSIMGVMFIPFGIVLNIIAINKAKQINNSIEKEKVLRTAKILLVVSAFMFLFTLLPIIFSI